MSSNATRNSTRRSLPKLRSKATAAVAVAVAALVIAAGNGYAGQAALAGYGLYLLLTRCVAKMSKRILDARRALRFLGWVAVLSATAVALNGTDAPGGPTFGLALAAATATYLKLTAQRTT